MSDRRWAHVRCYFLFFCIFFFFFFFSKFSDAFRQTSTLYSVWLTFVFLGERYRTSSASSGRACILSYFHQSRGDYLSVPSSSLSRRIFIATTKSFAAYEYRRFASLSYYGDRRSCSIRPTDTTIRPRRGSSSRINLTGCTSWANFPLSWHLFRALYRRTGNEHDETPRSVLSTGYFVI